MTAALKTRSSFMRADSKKDPKRAVAILSRESNSKTIDVKMLEDELLRRGIRTETLCRLLTKERSVRSLAYIGEIAKQIKAIAHANVVVLDTYCIPVSMIPHLGNTKVIQMWHALGAVKRFGWQTVGKEGGASERTARLMRMHKGYDFIVCPSDLTAEYFCEAFKTGREKVVKLGLPRIDYIKSVACGERRDETASGILSRYPQLKRNCEGEEALKTILYAPTFRRGKAVDVQSLVSALDTDKYNLVVKLHPLYRAEEAAAENIPVNVVFDDEFSSFDWLSLADIVISDYSSFVIEATLADKPLYIYAYDLDDYSVSTGLNIDFESEPIAPYVFRDASELASVLEEPYDIEKLRAFRKRYIDIDTEACTAELADFIESLL